ncbi:MAG: protease modulator HflC [Myxococcota bacterium]|jgi:membrane protease subunit HflC|nr:protease modulator HflC [Myxococcota bacterium]
MRRLLFVGLVGSALFAALIWAGEVGIGPVVVTHEDEMKIVLLFGSPVSVQTEPGLSLRVPFLSEVRTFDKRFLYTNAEPLPMQTRDAEQPVIDHYVVWRIRDPLQFFRSFPTGIQQASDQVDRVTRSNVREEVGKRTFAEVVTTARGEVMDSITEASAAELTNFGIEVRDVRINRTELPRSTEENVYARMRTERERLARKYRAEGDEEGRRVRAEADRAAIVTVAEATRQASELRGAGDAESARIYAEAHGQAPEFYGFLRRLEAYRKTIGSQTTLVLPPDNEFFELLESYRAK